MTSLQQLQESSRKYNELCGLSQGDIITTTSGKEYEFIALQRKYFTAKNTEDNAAYRIPVESYKELVKKAEKKEVNWKDLKKGELFYIIQRDNAILFKFEEYTKKGSKVMIKGLNIANNLPTRIDVSLYGGKVSEL